MFIVKCSWCNREISRAPGADRISHGICPPCYEKTMQEIKTFLPRNVHLIKSDGSGEKYLGRAVLGPGCLIFLPRSEPLLDLVHF